MPTTKVKPLADNVLVKLKKEEKVTDSGIVLPDTASEDKPQEGEVIAVGEGKYDDGVKIKPEVKKGDQIIFAKYSGTEIKINNQEHLILKSEDILAIIS
ncbi:MAG: co-chaperone GroES [Candidatus Moranbacteria bacterium]|nr:co-chaperone GroES [Candidatus Moranbacteria bacterium]